MGSLVLNVNLCEQLDELLGRDENLLATHRTGAIGRCARGDSQHASMRRPIDGSDRSPGSLTTWGLSKVYCDYGVLGARCDFARGIWHGQITALCL